MKPTLRARLREEDGASLMLTMVFVILIGLSLAALLDYASASVSSARSTADRHALASDTSAALDVAIDTLRNDDEPTGACPPLVDPDPLPGRQQIRLTCQPKPGTGTTVDAQHVTTTNRPAWAVLALAPLVGPETGLANASEGILRIKGKVDVASKITADKTYAQIEVDQGAVVARGSCPLDRVTSTVSVSCTDPAAATADPATPAWTVTPPDPLVPQVVPTSCPAGDAFELDPGYYDDAVTLSNLTTVAGGLACGKPVHFNPGVYFFDFRNEEMQEADALMDVPRGLNVWTIDDPSLSVVGGTEKGWVAGVPPIPGSCVSPLETTDPDLGVRFVFGGSSRMNVEAGKVELCGRYSTAAPAVVVQGSTESAVPTASATSTPTVAATPVVPPEVPFTTTGTTSTTTITRPDAGSTTARLVLDGLDATTSIPPRSVLTAATLTVTHQETGAITTGPAKDKLWVTAYPNASRTPPLNPVAPLPVTPTSTPSTVTVDLLSNLKPEVWNHGLAELRLDYTVVAVKKSLTNTTLSAELDSGPMVLTLEWTPPAVRGEATPIWGANCVGLGVPTCPLITTAAPSQLYLQGTTHAPYAAFEINAESVTAPVFESGIISRSLSITGTPPAGGYGGPIVDLPDLTVVTVEVYLTAYACAGTETECAGPPDSALWRLVGRSTVQLRSNYPLPADGLRQVNVVNWHVLE